MSSSRALVADKIETSEDNRLSQLQLSRRGIDCIPGRNGFAAVLSSHGPETRDCLFFCWGMKFNFKRCDFGAETFLSRADYWR